MTGGEGPYASRLHYASSGSIVVVSPRILHPDVSKRSSGGQVRRNLAVKLLRDRGNTFWTSTSWSSESSMKAFMHAKPHGPTMRSLLEWCDEAALVHWTQAGVELPSWEEAHTRIEQEGRPSKVNHPSAAHTAHKFPAPTVDRTRELKIK